MDGEQDVCLRELRAILACDQSDGYLKERARYWIEVIECHATMAADLTRIPVLTA
jgi:hypothetical protein